MVYDENDNEFLEKLNKAIATDEGFLVANYFKQKIREEFAFENIDTELTDEQAGREFKMIKKIKQFFDGLLIFNNKQE